MNPRPLPTRKENCSRRPVGDAPHKCCVGIGHASHREAATDFAADTVPAMLCDSDEGVAAATTPAADRVLPGHLKSRHHAGSTGRSMKRYLIKLSNSEEGPYDEAQMAQMFANKRIDRNTPCKA